MTAQSLLLLVVVLLVGSWGLWLVTRAHTRTAADVCLDLCAGGSGPGRAAGRGLDQLNDALGRLGLFRPAERWRYRLIERALPCAAILAAVLGAFAARAGAGGMCAALTIGWGAGFLMTRAYARCAASSYRRALEYHLPMVMERVVMAVEAGLDVLAAVSDIVRLERESERDAARHGWARSIDPVTRLLEIVLQLTESGLSFESACAAVVVADCPALKHAFVHLALAHKEGGELAAPLRELSDATQLYYQETIEEEIAALPVKATLPLVCTFAGLIICFITAPLLQVMKITGQAMLR